jgi:exopolysaccharide biosynthesis protein
VTPPPIKAHLNRILFLLINILHDQLLNGYTFIFYFWLPGPLSCTGQGVDLYFQLAYNPSVNKFLISKLSTSLKKELTMRRYIWLLLLSLLFMAIIIRGAGVTVIVNPPGLEARPETGPEKIKAESAESENIIVEADVFTETEIIIAEIIGKEYRGYEAVIKNPAAVIVTTERESTLDAFERNSGKFAVNGGGFVGNTPIGNTVVNGKLTGPFKPTEHRWDMFIGFDKNNNLVGGRVNSYNTLKEMAPVYGISFGPALIIDGQPQHIETRDLHPRTAVGQLACGSLLFIVIDGRQAGWSRGITVNDLRDLFMERGAVNAFNLDGGGSTAMVYDGKVLNKPSGGRLRVVANNIVVL